ncbi:MAG: 3-isopropylmalate dehydratase large subunit [Candidatus Coatesbacteria bacterium]|nr:MAG: 3-isopropylmalate dehydratase large subunit [Candidatus Coatesbacteria bacterium]
MATIIEKILASHTGDDVHPGATVWLDLDVRAARDFGGASVVGNFEAHYAGEPVADAARTFFTFDCVVPANNIPFANNQQRCREFASRHGVKVFDVDAGIGSHVLMEEGLALPGGTVVNTDSHMNVVGAIGGLGLGMGDADVAFAFRTGRTWLEVPPSVKVEVRGRYEWPTTAKDLALALLREFGSNALLGRAVELYGPAVEALAPCERVTVASMATELGAVAILIPPDEEVLQWCARYTDRVPEPVAADAEAAYEATYELDVDGLEPLVACPPSPANVKPAAEVAGKAIGSAFFGSCTNGRLTDFRAVRDVAAGHKVAAGVVAYAVPATRRVFANMLAEGIVAALFEAGFVLSNPGCGGCAQGQIGMTGRGEVQVSTSNRNFPGKQGAGETYLCSPATAAASALHGRITDPREVI